MDLLKPEQAGFNRCWGIFRRGRRLPFYVIWADARIRPPGPFRRAARLEIFRSPGSVLKLHAGLLRHRLHFRQGPPAKSLILRGPFLFVLGGSQFRLRQFSGPSDLRMFGLPAAPSWMGPRGVPGRHGPGRRFSPQTPRRSPPTWTLPLPGTPRGSPWRGCGRRRAGRPFQ